MPYKYFAFISYNSKDVEWGKRLQRKLEHYRMPATLCSEHNWKSRTPINPVFFAPTDIQPGGLSNELKQRLECSEHLVVICSPNSAKSTWVGKEIAFFYGLGRANNIHFFIVEGVPHSGNEDMECFNPILKELNMPEVLGANINESIYRFSWLNRERAYIQLITKLLNVDFDVLWNRHRRLIIQKTVAWTLGAMAVLVTIAIAFFISKPVSVEMTLNEVTPVNSNLPPMKDAKVSLVLENEKKDTTFATIGDKLTFSNVPHSMIGKEVEVHFSCADYMSLDTTFVLDKRVVLNIKRDPDKYGHERFVLYDREMTPIPNAKMIVDGREVTTDAEGKVDIMIPIGEQKMRYKVTAPNYKLDHDLLDAFCGDSECFCVE